MKHSLKKLTNRMRAAFNIRLKRTLNGKKLIVPLINGIKVGISGEKWMSGLLSVIFSYSDGAFYDIGANRGQTLIKVKTVDENRCYIGFEPNPSCLFYLQQLIACNNWANTTLVPIGIYISNDLMELSGDSDIDGGATIIEEYKKDSSTVSKLVPLFSYDTIRHCLPEQRIAAIKIDIEGAELEVVESLSNLIEEQRPILIIEIWQNGNDAFKKNRTQKLSNLMTSMNYNSYGLIMNSDGNTYLGLEKLSLGSSHLDNYVLLPKEKERDIWCI